MLNLDHAYGRLRPSGKRSAINVASSPCWAVLMVCVYEPVLRMDGRTSDVTHLRNFLASGFRDRRTRAYSPDSLMMLTSRFWETPFYDLTSIILRAASSSSRFCNAIVTFDSSSTAQTSLATNQMSPSLLMARIEWDSNANGAGTAFDFAIIGSLRFGDVHQNEGGRDSTTVVSRLMLFPCRVFYLHLSSRP